MKLKILYIVGVLLQFIGWFYALLPHAMHEKLSVGFGVEHNVHTIIGVSLVVLGVGTLVCCVPRNAVME